MATRPFRHSVRLWWLLHPVLGLWGLMVAAVWAGEFDSAAVQRFVAEAFAADRVPGGAVAIVVDGELAFLQGFGHDAMGRPVTPETGFRLGSMSKAFTALAALVMADRGLVQMDAPVRSVLDEFRLADMVSADAITLRHLLHHTSGIPERAPRADAGASLAGHVAALAPVVPVAAPGERHIYASPNYLVVARLLEMASGTPFATIVRREIFEPLGMAHSFTSAAEDTSGLISGGHIYWFGYPVVSSQPEEPGRLATASLVSSAADMARFLQFQLGDGTFDGRRLLSGESMTAMHQGAAAGDGFRYAMGWRDTQVLGARVLEHGGILPDYRGKMVLLPDRNAALVVLTNASTMAPLPAVPTSHRVADSLAEYLLGETLRPPTVTFGLVSLAVAVGLGLVLLAAARGLVAVVSGRDRRSRQRLRAVADLTVVAALAVGLPMVLGLDWPSIVAMMPDFSLWLAAVATLSVMTALARLIPTRRGTAP